MNSNPIKNFDVYVTGSNSRMLSKDIATEFRGRATQIHVYPLSFAEFYSYIGGDTRDALGQYMLYGGMPRITALENEEDKKSYLTNLYDKLYVKSKTYFNYLNKYYYTDIGLRNARLNYRQFDPGHIMENIIYNALVRRGYSP